MKTFQSGTDLVTFKAAYGHLVSEGSVDCSGFVKLADLSTLLVKKPKNPPKGWSFTGNWTKSVQPYFNG